MCLSSGLLSASVCGAVRVCAYDTAGSRLDRPACLLNVAVNGGKCYRNYYYLYTKASARLDKIAKDCRATLWEPFDIYVANSLLPVVLYGCETWSLILREERRLRVLRRIGC